MSKKDRNELVKDYTQSGRMVHSACLGIISQAIFFGDSFYNCAYKTNLAFDYLKSYCRNNSKCGKLLTESINHDLLVKN